jgi:hypothetical protein
MNVIDLNNDCDHNLQKFLHTKDALVLKRLLQHFFLLSSFNQILIIKTLRNKKLLLQAMSYWKRARILPDTKDLTNLVFSFIDPRNNVSLKDKQDIIDTLYAPITLEFHPEQQLYEARVQDDLVRIEIHPNGSDVILNANVDYGNMIHYNYLKLYNEFMRYITLTSDQGHRDLALRWSDMYLNRIREDFAHNHVYVEFILAGLYETNLLDYERLNIIWNINTDVNYRMHVADYANIRIRDTNTSQDLLDLVNQIRAWFQAHIVAQQAIFDGNANGYAGSHSIHALDGFRRAYVVALMDKTCKMTQENIAEVEGFIKSLSLMIHDSSSMDARIYRAIQEISTYTSVFEPVHMWTVQMIFERVCWLILQLKNNYKSKFDAVKLEECEKNKYRIPENLTLSVDERIELQKEYDELKQKVEEAKQTSQEEFEQATMRLKQELSDMAGTCISGHLNRIFNSLEGFVCMIKVNYEALIKEQIETFVKTHAESDELLEQMVEGEYTYSMQSVIMQCTVHVFKYLRTEYGPDSGTSCILTVQECIKNFFGHEALKDFSFLNNINQWYEELFATQ